MEEIAISKFKATCLAVLERVRKTQTPIRVTRFGKAIAVIHPARTGRVPRLGTGVGTAVILGDIVGPISDISDWEAERDPDRVLDPNRDTVREKEPK